MCIYCIVGNTIDTHNTINTHYILKKKKKKEDHMLDKRYFKMLSSINKDIEDIQFFVEFGFYFIERSGKYLYFISGEATNEIYIFSLHE